MARGDYTTPMPRAPRKTPTPAKQQAAPTIDPMLVAWMLSVMTTLVCELIAVAGRVYLRYVDGAAVGLAVLTGTMTFAAVVVGSVALGMTAVVVKYRASRVPRSVVGFAAVVGAIPWLTLLVLRALQ